MHTSFAGRIPLGGKPVPEPITFTTAVPEVAFPSLHYLALHMLTMLPGVEEYVTGFKMDGGSSERCSSAELLSLAIRAITVHWDW